MTGRVRWGDYGRRKIMAMIPGKEELKAGWHHVLTRAEKDVEVSSLVSIPYPWAFPWTSRGDSDKHRKLPVTGRSAMDISNENFCWIVCSQQHTGEHFSKTA